MKFDISMPLYKNETVYRAKVAFVYDYQIPVIIHNNYINFIINILIYIKIYTFQSLFKHNYYFIYIKLLICMITISYSSKIFRIFH